MADAEEEDWTQKEDGQAHRGYGQMDAAQVRHTAEKYSGRTDLLPEDIDDPELLLRGLVRKYNGELKAAQKRQSIAEHHASSLKKRVDMLQESYDEAQATVDQATKELKTAQKEVQEYQTKIAFLGNRWETLTGQPNEELMRDGNAQAKKYKGELRVVKSELFVAKLTQRTLAKEIGVWKSTLNENEGRQSHLHEELVDTRLKDQDLEQDNIRVQHLRNKSEQELHEERLIVQEKTSKVRQLDKRMKTLQEDNTVVLRAREKAERHVIGLKKQIVGHAEEVAAIEEKTRQAAETAAVLEKRCLEQEAIVKEQSSTITVLRTDLAEEKRWNAIRQSTILELQDAIEQVKIERNEVSDLSKRFEKTGLLHGRRAREFEEEASALATNVADSSSNLVRVTHELSDERKRVKELRRQLEETRMQLKEYKGLAAERKNRLEQTEDKLQQTVAQVKECETREYNVKRDLRSTQGSLKDSMSHEKDSAAEVVRIAASLQASQREYVLLQKEVKRLNDVISELKKNLDESRASTRTYRNKSEILEGELGTTKHRVQVTEEHAYSLRVDRDKFSDKFLVEQGNGAALGGQVEVMVAQLRKLELEAKQGRKREEDLHDEIKKLKEKVKDERARGDSYAAGQATAEGEREVFKGKSMEFADEASTKKRALRNTQAELIETNTDLQGIKGSHGRLTQQIAQVQTNNAGLEAEIARLTKELKSTTAKLKHEEAESSRLNEELQSATEKLDDYALEANDSRVRAKDLTNKLKFKTAGLDRVEVEFNFSRNSVERVCDDYQALDDKYHEEQRRGKQLENDIRNWRQKLQEAETQAANFKDVNWRIAQDLENSTKSCREAEAMVKKLSAEDRSNKARLQELEQNNSDLNSNVGNLIGTVQDFEQKQKEALLAAASPTTQKTKKKSRGSVLHDDSLPRMTRKTLRGSLTTGQL